MQNLNNKKIKKYLCYFCVKKNKFIKFFIKKLKNYSLCNIINVPRGNVDNSFSLRFNFVKPVAFENIPNGIFDITLCSTLTVSKKLTMKFFLF